MNLKNSQYQAIMRQYDLRQMEHRHQQTLRYEELCNKLPAYRDLEDQIAALYADRARAAVLGQAVQLQDMLQQIQTLQHQQRILMTRAGYPSDYLALTYTCPDCQDTGFIGAEKCHCFLQAEIDLLYHQSNLNEVLKQENFDTFSYNWYDGDDRDSMRRTVAEARLFIENFDKQFQNLLLLGAVGTGKTFLSNCIAKELMDS